MWFIHLLNHHESVEHLGKAFQNHSVEFAFLYKDTVLLNSIYGWTKETSSAFMTWETVAQVAHHIPLSFASSSSRLSVSLYQPLFSALKILCKVILRDYLHPPLGVSGRSHYSNLPWSHFQFAEWCLDYGEHGCRTPDTPFSLFEGIFHTFT